jgi:DNA-binding transcriptional ArsR family regulator
MDIVSWLTALRAGLGRRLRSLMPVVPIVAFALMMVVPSVAAVAGPGPVTAEADGDTSVVADLPDTVLDDSTWTNSSFLLAPLYLRIPQPQLLNHSLRGEIFEFVNRNPGATFTQVRDGVGAASGTVQHHLRVLARGNVLRSVKTGKYTRYWPCNHRVLAMGPSEESIVKSLASDGPATKAELAHRTGMSRQLVHYHVERMAEEGLVMVDRDNGSPVVRLGSPATRF